MSERYLQIPVQAQDGPGGCIPQAVSCDGLTVTIGKDTELGEAQLDLNRLFDSLGIAPTLPNLDAIGSTTYCSALDSSAHKCITGGTFTFPQQIDGKSITPEALAGAINKTSHAVYYKDPQTWFDTDQTSVQESVQSENSSSTTPAEDTTSGADVDRSNSESVSIQTFPTPTEVPSNSQKLDLTGVLPIALGAAATAVATGIAIKGIRNWMEKSRKEWSDSEAQKIVDNKIPDHENRLMKRVTSQPGFFADPEDPNVVLTKKPPIIESGTPLFNNLAKNGWLEKERERIRNAPISQELTNALEITTHPDKNGRPELDEVRGGWLIEQYPELNIRRPDPNFKGEEGYSPRPKVEGAYERLGRTSGPYKEIPGWGKVRRLILRK